MSIENNKAIPSETTSGRLEHIITLNKLFEDLAFRNSSKHLNLWPLMLCGNYHGGNKEPEDGQNCMTEYLKNRIWS